MTLTVGERAPEVRFGLADGETTLSELCRDRPLVVAFMRHFG
jgi:hypothetical protein